MTEDAGPTVAQLNNALIKRLAANPREHAVYAASAANNITAKAQVLAIEAIETWDEDEHAEAQDDPGWAATYVAMRAVIEAMDLEKVVTEVASRIQHLVGGEGGKSQ
jgi:hypothetical protein